MTKSQNKGGIGNPNHDEEGKFTSEDGASEKVASEDVKEEPKKQLSDADDSFGSFKSWNFGDSIDDFLDTFEGGLTKREKYEEAVKIAEKNKQYLDYTNYNSSNLAIEEKKEIIDVSSMGYDKEKIADITDEEVDAIFGAECIVNASKQVQGELALQEKEKEGISSSVTKEANNLLVNMANDGYKTSLYGVWMGSVDIVNDYEKKAKIDETGTSAIDRKKAYYQEIIDDPLSFEDDIQEAQKKLNELNAWVEAGEKFKTEKEKIAAKYIDLQEEADNKISELKKKEAFLSSDDFQIIVNENKKFLENYQDKKSAYSEARKNAAIWFKTDDEGYALEKARAYFKPQMMEKLKTLTSVELKIAENYTGGGYSKFNKPLRKIEQDPNGYSFDSSTGTFSKAVTNLTNAIDKCTWDEDIWVQRGIDDTNMFPLPGSSKLHSLHSMTDAQLNSLVGMSFTDGGFFSAGAGKGTGFTGHNILFNVYCPKGTKMIYAEAFSHYKGENEMILQRGYSYKITKIDKKGYQYYVDLEVVLGSDDNKPVGNDLKSLGNQYYYGPRGLSGESYD